MSDGSRSGGSRRRARVIATLAGGALAASGVIAVGAALAAQQPAPPRPPASAGAEPTGPAPAEAAPAAGANEAAEPEPAPAREPEPRADSADSRAESGADTVALDYSKPVRVSIPSIGVSSSLVDLGLDAEGVMETPQDPDKAGWFTPSPAPGVPGAAVIAGHVTWDQEPTVFFRLGDLRSGDRVEVARKDGTTAVFEVRRVAEFAKDSFPTEAVYGQVDHPGLRLITCGGVYDEQTNDYRSNLIVWARMVGSHPTRA